VNWIAKIMLRSPLKRDANRLDDCRGALLRSVLASDYTAHDLPNKADKTQNQRRRLDRLWTTLSGFESLPPSQFVRKQRTRPSCEG